LVLRDKKLRAQMFHLTAPLGLHAASRVKPRPLKSGIVLNSSVGSAEQKTVIDAASGQRLGRRGYKRRRRCSN
jgi:hypothetical protein